MARSIEDAKELLERLGLHPEQGMGKEAMKLAVAGFSYTQIYRYFKGPTCLPKPYFSNDPVGFGF